jgi:Aldolase/RraA
VTSPHPLAKYSTATVSDALDRLGRPGSMLGLAPLSDGARLCGRAFTVRYVTAGSPPGTVGDYLDDVPPGAVVVLDNGGRTDCTVWGDILTAMAADRGIGGTEDPGRHPGLLKDARQDHAAAHARPQIRLQEHGVAQGERSQRCPGCRLDGRRRAAPAGAPPAREHIVRPVRGIEKTHELHLVRKSSHVVQVTGLEMSEPDPCRALSSVLRTLPLVLRGNGPPIEYRRGFL